MDGRSDGSSGNEETASLAQVGLYAFIRHDRLGTLYYAWREVMDAAAVLVVSETVVDFDGGWGQLKKMGGADGTRLMADKCLNGSPVMVAVPTKQELDVLAESAGIGEEVVKKMRDEVRGNARDTGWPALLVGNDAAHFSWYTVVVPPWMSGIEAVGNPYDWARSGPEFLEKGGRMSGWV